MNKPSRIVSFAPSLALCMIAALPLTACQTSGSAYRAEPVQTRVADNSGLPQFVEDRVYISHVERMAASRGITVHWVHRPQKRQPSQAAETRQD